MVSKRLLAHWIGRQQDVDGQRFEVVDVTVVQFSQNGRFVPMLTWASRCRECGAAYTIETCRKPNPLHLRRLCDTHHVTVRRARSRPWRDVQADIRHERDEAIETRSRFEVELVS